MLKTGITRQFPLIYHLKFKKKISNGLRGEKRRIFNKLVTRFRQLSLIQVVQWFLSYEMPQKKKLLNSFENRKIFGKVY
jgi:hypothetical protein